MNAYISIKAPNNPSALKIQVPFPEWEPVLLHGRRIRQNVVGDHRKSIGKTKRIFAFVARIYMTPAVGFASLADVEGWATNTTAANHVLTFWDFNGTSYTVFLDSDLPQNILSPLYLNSNMFVDIPLRLIER